MPRLFTGEFGFEIGWLLPAALLAIVLVLVSRRPGAAHRPDAGGRHHVRRLDRGRRLVLSYMKGMVHPYYCLSLAPAVAGMFAIGVHEMWRNADVAAAPTRPGGDASDHRRVELGDPAPQRRWLPGAALGRSWRSP